MFLLAIEKDRSRATSPSTRILGFGFASEKNQATVMCKKNSFDIGVTDPIAGCRKSSRAEKLSVDVWLRIWNAIPKNRVRTRHQLMRSCRCVNGALRESWDRYIAWTVAEDWKDFANRESAMEQLRQKPKDADLALFVKRHTDHACCFVCRGLIALDQTGALDCNCGEAARFEDKPIFGH